MPAIRVAFCQLNQTVGDLAGNVKRICEALDLAEDAGADLALFPELALCGYPPEDLLLEPAFIDAARRSLDVVVSRTRRTAAVVGFVEPAGGSLYNAAAIACGGELRGVWRKELLPNYGVFDERRWFTRGSDATPLFEIAGVRVGVTICEDAWSAEGPVVRQGRAGAELVVSINASPYRRDVLCDREAMLRARAQESDAAIAYCNLVGGQDELIFDGASMVLSPAGALVCRLPQFEEAFEVLDLEVAPKAPPAPGQAVEVLSRESRAEGPARPPRVCDALDRTTEVYRALVLATRDYVGKNGFVEVGIGLSGGIDSALVAAIATDAIGAARVHGVAMPSRYSSEGSVSDAAALAHRFGIDFRTIPIEPVHAAFLELLAPSFEGLGPDLAEENVQARARGTLMMALSNKLGWLILTTGNKSETSVGYATLYGDMAGGFAVIKDVPKLLVYELARWRNALAGTDVIPQAILDKAPSAELRPDQRDEDSLPPYAVLDPILEGYIEYGKTISDLEAEGYAPDVVRRVFDLVDRAEYKRRQAPPGPRVTHRAFGKDRRMPIVNGFRASRPWWGGVV